MMNENDNKKVWDYLTYLQEKHPDEEIVLANKFFDNKNGLYSFTKWTPMNQWKGKYPTITPNYRGILPSEIVLETDFGTRSENAQWADKVCKILDAWGISYLCVWTGNKSYHIHFFAPLLLKQAEEDREFIKKEIVKKYLGIADEYAHRFPEDFKDLSHAIDQSNFRAKRLTIIETARNPSTGASTEVYKQNIGTEIPYVFIQGLDLPTKRPVKEIFRDKSVPVTCPLLEHALTNKWPVSDRNSNLIPNFVAVYKDQDMWEKCADCQDKKVIEFINWAKRSPNFSCAQLRKYAETIGLKYICTNHLLEGC